MNSGNPPGSDHVRRKPQSPDLREYAIDGPRGRGDICLNGAAARLAHPGDLVIILTYAEFDESELVGGYEPTVVHVNSRNEVTELVEDMVPVMWEVD